MACGKNMRETYGDSSKLHGSLNFAFDQREMEVNLHKVAFSTSNVSPASRPFENLHDGKNINQSNCKKRTRLNLFRTSENLKRTCLPTHFLH